MASSISRSSSDSSDRPCSHYGASVDDGAPSSPSTTSSWIRDTSVTPDSPESIEGQSTPRLPPKMQLNSKAQGALGTGETSATSSSNVGRQPDSREQSTSATSGGVLASTFFEGPLPDSIPSTMNMSRRQMDYQGYSGSRRYEDIETMNTADEGPEKHEASLGSQSATTSVAELKISMGFTSPNISREPVQPDFGRSQPGMGTGSRSPSRPGSPNGSLSSPDEDLKLSEESDEAAYETLVESITSLVIDSPCVDDLKDRRVPLESYIHLFLEQICNHKDSGFQRHTSPLPIRTLPIRVCNPGANVSKSRAPTGVGRKDNGGNRKRKNGEDNGGGRGGKDTDNNDSCGDAGDGSEDDSEQSKRQKTDDEHDGNYICHFRKRNPVRFNVRTHPQCALRSFKTLTLLKRHIKNFHGCSANDSHRCNRCRGSFPNEESLINHQRGDKRCDVATDPDVYDDPEDGISTSVMQKLVERANGKKINSWKAIWRLLFPGDEYVPESEKHEPPVELDEVQDKFYDRETLVSFLKEKDPFRPDEAQTGDHGYQYIIGIFSQCRDEQGHDISTARVERDRNLMEMVQALKAFPRHHPGQPPAKQADQDALLSNRLNLQPPHYNSINPQNLLIINPLSSDPNSSTNPPPLPWEVNNTLFNPQNGALSSQRNTNLPSESLTAVDSEYCKMPSGPMPTYGQHEASWEAPCHVPPQAEISSHDNFLLGMEKDVFDVSNDFSGMGEDFSGMGKDFSGVDNQDRYTEVGSLEQPFTGYLPDGSYGTQ